MRLFRDRTHDDDGRYAQLMDDVASGDGFTTEIRGVKIQKCDEYGKTDTDYKLQLAQVYVDQERQLVDMIAAERDRLQARIRELEREADERDKAHEGIVAMLGKEARADIASARAKVTLLAERLDERTLQRDRKQARIDKALAIQIPGPLILCDSPYDRDEQWRKAIRAALAADTPTTATTEGSDQ
jgi:uncharacterized coiled-coil protein SlyX